MWVRRSAPRDLMAAAQLDEMQGARAMATIKGKASNAPEDTGTQQAPGPKATQFKPGQSGNPKGRPKGARNRLGTQFLEALEADFNKHGAQAIALVREKKPEVYIKVVADLLPKEANINVEAGEAFVELWRKISEGLGDELADRLDDEPIAVVH
jgi:Family of unknown function (DUF5681)